MGLSLIHSHESFVSNVNSFSFFTHFLMFTLCDSQVDSGACFSGGGASALVLKGVNLTVHSGEVMAILGSKGICVKKFQS